MNKLYINLNVSVTDDNIDKLERLMLELLISGMTTLSECEKACDAIVKLKSQKYPEKSCKVIPFMSTR
ncbi:hypothetical protein NBE98_09535 [Clostridium swellfunianum]|uniref:hypothetical protein n=1 Tax=Clostridium swellfunianum TaxID=1367462 RepID=UPI002030EA3F|nr:hypothetical protein [Clostridium swellfunianum]MCM0648614.1 hypothetical protein [Clostridium swellfunianum]